MKVFYNFLLKFKFFRKCFYEREFSNLGEIRNSNNFYMVSYPFERYSKSKRPKYFLRMFFIWVISLFTLIGTDKFITLFIPIIPFVFFIYSYYRYCVTKPKGNQFFYSVEQKLCDFISLNRFFETERREREIKKDDKYVIEHYDCVINYIQFGIAIVDDCLVIRVYKRADKFLNVVSELESYFKVLFSYKLKEKKDNNSTCDYIFNLKDKERLKVSKENYNVEVEQQIDNERIALSSDLFWNFTKSPHALICGSTGGGKSTFIDYLIIEFLKRKADVYICDPKQSDLSNLSLFFGQYSNRVVGEPNHIARVVREVYEEMNLRYDTYIKNPDVFKYGANYIDYGLKPVVLFFDEFTSFRLACDKKVNDEVMKRLSEIILKGRQMGVFCILSTQQPNAESIPTQLRDNLSLRISLGSLSSEGYRMLFGSGYDLKNVEGLGVGYIYINGLGWDMPLEFQSPYMALRGLDFTQEIERYASSL